MVIENAGSPSSLALQRSKTAQFSLQEFPNRPGSRQFHIYWKTGSKFSPAVTAHCPECLGTQCPLGLQPSPTLNMYPLHTTEILTQCPHQQSVFCETCSFWKNSKLLGWGLTTCPPLKRLSLWDWTIAEGFTPKQREPQGQLSSPGSSELCQRFLAEG